MSVVRTVAMADALPRVLHSTVGGNEKRSALRTAVTAGEAIMLPGVYDALTAVLAEQAGFKATYLTGAGLANTQLAAPDVGLLSFDTIATQALRICGATEGPLIVDIDTGFGGPASVMHVVRTLESFGVAAVQMEDQAMPKRCGHFAGKHVVGVSEMQSKVDAATRARKDDNFLIIARTDALAVTGLDDALARARAYLEAGADVIFVEAPTSRELVAQIPNELPGVPLLINVVPGGRTPDIPAAELSEMGYTFVLHANLVLRTMMCSVGDMLTHLQNTGDGASRSDQFVSWQERQHIVQLAEFDSLENALAARWSAGTPGAGG